MTRNALKSVLAGLLLATFPAPATFAEGPCVDDKQHGQWTFRLGDWHIGELEFRDGEPVE